MAYCRECGNEVPSGNRFCRVCGAEVLQSVRNEENNDESRAISGSALSVTVADNPISRKSDKKKRSLLWMAIAVASIVMAITSWFVPGIPLTIFLVVTSFALAVLSLVFRAKFRAISILAIIISGLLLVSWIIQGVLDLKDGKFASEQTAEVGDVVFIISSAYHASESEKDGFVTYTFQRGGEGGFLDLYNEKIDDDDEWKQIAAIIALNPFLTQEVQVMVDEFTDEAIKGAAKEINAENVTFVKDVQIAGIPGKEYSFTAKDNDLEYNGLIACALDWKRERVYGALMGETVGASKSRLPDFDSIVASATLKTDGNGTTEKGGSSGSGSLSAPLVDPKFKATMDSYEAFLDEYIAFIKKYENAGDSLDAFTMLSEYTDYLTKYSDMMQKLGEIDPNSLSAADYAYYLEVTARIYNKLSDLE